MSEGQFRQYVKDALNSATANPIEKLFTKLERRLDNIVFKLGFAKSRQMARQLVVHGHFSVNGKRVSIPSYQVQEGDEIEVRERSRNKGPFANISQEREEFSPPQWLSVDYGQKKGVVKALPAFKTEDRAYDLTSVIEFYSR